jgi:hypothetical protein
VSAAWTYDGYWHAVIGQQTPEQIACDSALFSKDSDEGHISSVLFEAEHQAAEQGGIARPDEWAAFHERAVDRIFDAIQAVQS